MTPLTAMVEITLRVSCADAVSEQLLASGFVQTDDTGKVPVESIAALAEGVSVRPIRFVEAS